MPAIEMYLVRNHQSDLLRAARTHRSVRRTRRTRRAS
jgi:hypothetical protein